MEQKQDEPPLGTPDPVRPNAIRDTIHKWIRFNACEKRVIDSAPFQRLRFAKQTTCAYFVYPDALHSRFSHSLGVMHVATLYAEAIAARYGGRFDARWVETVRMAALLHDVAHGPFSHAFDELVYSHVYEGTTHGHDEHRKVLVAREPLRSRLRACGVEPDDVVGMWCGRDKVASAVLQGPLGADRTDFLLRDSHNTATEAFGGVDYHRMVHNVRVVDGCLVYPEKMVGEIQNFITGRLWMYSNVYHHRTSQAAFYLLKRIIDACREPLRLVERTMDDGEFVLMTEEGLLNEALGVPAARPYVLALLRRQLPAVAEVLATDGNAPVAGPGEHVLAMRPMETLDQTKFKKTSVRILLKSGELVDAHGFLREHGIIKDAVYAKHVIVQAEAFEKELADAAAAATTADGSAEA